MRDFRIEPTRFAHEDELPLGAKRALWTARENGWKSEAIRSFCYDVDTTHYDAAGNWDMHRVEMMDEPVVDESGKPELTPTGRPKVRKMPRLVMGVPVPVTREVITITAENADSRGIACWAYLSTRPQWAFDFAAVRGPGQVTSSEFTAWLKESR